jgi:hypothetical protein
MDSKLNSNKMKNLSTKEIIRKILQNRITAAEMDEFKLSIKSDPSLAKEFKNQLGLLVALKTIDDLDFKEKIDKIFLELEKERERERDRELEL